MLECSRLTLRSAMAEIISNATIGQYYDFCMCLPEEQLQQIILKLQEAIKDPNKPHVVTFNYDS